MDSLKPVIEDFLSHKFVGVIFALLVELVLLVIG